MCQTCIYASIVMLAAYLAEAAAEVRPIMGLSTESWDFGTLEQGQTATTEVQVANKGNADLKITFIRSTCATCVGNISGARLIKPGSVGKIVLSFYSKGLLGKQSRVVYVHSNDPVHPYKPIRIVGTVRRSPRPEIHLSAETTDLGLVRKGESAIHAFAIENRGKAPLTISGIVTSGACRTQASEEVAIEPGGRQEFRVTILGAKLDGLIQEYLTIHSNDPITPSKTIMLVGYAAGSRVAATPAHGITIVPQGKPVKVPGTGAVFYRSYRVVNRLPTKVGLRVTCNARENGVLELSPGETRTIETPRLLLAAEQPAKAVLEFTVSLPAVMRPK